MNCNLKKKKNRLFEKSSYSDHIFTFCTGNSLVDYDSKFLVKSRLFRILKSTIFTQRNLVKVRYSWGPHFGQVSWWLNKNCGCFNKSIFLSESEFAWDTLHLDVCNEVILKIFEIWMVWIERIDYMMMEYCGNELKFIIFVNITLQYEGQFTEFLLFCGFFTH